jgi:hypothetical protein
METLFFKSLKILILNNEKYNKEIDQKIKKYVEIQF